VKHFKINELCVLLKRGKSPKYGQSNIQIIKSGQARGYLAFDFKERYFVSEDFILDERKLQKGDLLINSTGVGTAGRVTLFELEGNFVADSHITIFRTNEKVLPKFALYSLANIGFKTIEKMANGSSGQIELTLKTIGNIAFLVPDIATQEQIVSEVSEIEEKIAELQVIMEGSQERKKEILNQYLL
ncbi:restriction endonuclease subunit S, partial [Avibacterium paragallinarum]